MQSWEKTHAIGSHEPTTAGSTTPLPAFQLKPTFLTAVEKLASASLILPFAKGPAWGGGDVAALILREGGHLTLSPTVLSLLFMPA